MFLLKPIGSFFTCLHSYAFWPCAVAVFWFLATRDMTGQAVMPAAGAVVVGLATWLVYVADRLAEAWRQQRRDTLRHGVLYRNRHRLLQVGAGVLVVTVLGSWALFGTAVVVRGLGFGALVLLYLALAHLLPASTWRMLLKRFLVGLLFATGVTLPFWGQTDALLGVGLLWLGLAWSNLMLLSVHEARLARSAGPGEVTLAAFYGVVLFSAVVFLSLVFAAPGSYAYWQAGAGLAAVACLLLLRWAPRWNRPLFESLADALLVIPALPVFFF